MGGLLHLVQRGGLSGARSPPRPLLAVPNVTAHPSTASVPITVLLYNGPLLCDFNVAIKGLVAWTIKRVTRGFRHSVTRRTAISPTRRRDLR